MRRVLIRSLAEELHQVEAQIQQNKRMRPQELAYERMVKACNLTTLKLKEA